MGTGHTLSFGCPWQGHCPYGNPPIDSEVVEFLHLRSSVPVCLSVHTFRDRWRICRRHTGSDSARDELRESRDSAHDCQSRELRCCTTHAGVVTICTVPEFDAGCLGHSQYTLSRTLSRDETSLQPAQPVCSADDGCLVVSCHFINHRRPLRGARRPHGGE